MESYKNIKILLTSIIVLCIGSSMAKAQTDTLVFKNGASVVGEIKSLDRGVIYIETAYSDSDFGIEWDQVTRISSVQSFLITLSDGRRFNASVNSTKVPNQVEINNGQSKEIIDVIDIVYIKPISQSFWDKFSASIDVNLDLTKANNLTQFSTRTSMGYLTKRWELRGNYNTLFSSQDSVATTKRMDANITFKFFLPNDFYVFYSNDFLQNDEQKLKLRSTSKIGLGYYMIHTNSVYWTAYGGAAANAETFTEATSPDKQSGEAFIGTELNLFDMGDLSLVTSAVGYPSLTEDGRFRLDFKFDIKYDLPLDFYIKAGTTVNFDNAPIPGAAELDYIIQTGIGWEW